MDMRLYASKVVMGECDAKMSVIGVEIPWNRISSFKPDFLYEFGPIMRCEYFDTIDGYDKVIYIKANDFTVK